MMKIEVINTEADWQALATAWNQLLDQSATDVPFLRHEYLSAWWQHKGGGEWPADSQLHICLGRDENDTLRGIAPLFCTRLADGRYMILLLGSIEISDFLDFIAAEEDLPAFTEAVLAYFSSDAAPHWDMLSLYNILEESPSLPALAAAAEKHGLNYSAEREQPAPYIPLPDDFDTYFEQLDKKYRHEFRRKLRNAAGFFIPVSTYTVEDPEMLDEEFEAFTELMVQERNKKNFLTPAMKEQMRAIVKATFDAGYLNMDFLVAGKEKAAATLNFDYKNRIWGYNTGLNMKYHQLAPGAVSLGYSIQKSIENGREAYDLLRGDEAYKYHVGGIDRFVMKVEITK